VHYHPTFPWRFKAAAAESEEDAGDGAGLEEAGEEVY